MTDGYRWWRNRKVNSLNLKLSSFWNQLIDLLYMMVILAFNELSQGVLLDVNGESKETFSEPKGLHEDV